jgi:hypothetical protein
MTEYIVYYKLPSGGYRVCFSKTLEVHACDRLPEKFSNFQMTKPYDANDECLIQYCKDIKIASDELKKTKELKGFDYIKPFTKSNGDTFYKTHDSNIEAIIKMRMVLNDDHDAIDIIEDKWFKGCFNGGLQYCKPGTYDCYGYDFTNYYASILGDSNFQIPTKQGQEKQIDKLTLKDNLLSVSPGFYRVKITCDNEDVKKVFNFSKNHIYYSHYLKFAYNELKDKFNMKFELILDGEPNAYVYDFKDFIKSKPIFRYWYDDIVSLKKKLPKNILVKMISSSAWGHLSRRHIKVVKEIDLTDEMGYSDEYNYKIIDVVINEDSSLYYKVIDVQKPYKYNLRLKPFITSFGRIQTAKIALENLDSVIRIHTDGIVFDKPITTDLPNFIPEKKTTGRIQWNNVNDYHRI